MSLAPILPNNPLTAPQINWTVLLLSLMMVLAPALGVPGEELLQDSLKSILVSFFALAATLVFFWHQRKQNVTVHLHYLLCLPLGLMVYALGSMAWSHAYLGAVEAIRWFVFSLILFLGMNSLTLARVTSLVWGIHLGAVLASLWAALQFWVDFKLFAQGPNPASTFVNRNFFGEFIVCTLPFSVLLLSRVRDKASVFLLTFSLGFNVVALMMTGTRSALIGLLVLVVLLPGLVLLYKNQFVSTGWRIGHVFAVAALLITTVLVLGSINTANPKLMADYGRGDAIDVAFKRTVSITKATEYSHGTFSMRALMWKSTGRMIQANPATGVGAGAWEVQAPLYQATGSQLETDYYAHNEILQLLAEYGLVGWLFLLCLLTYLSWAAYRTWSDQTCEGKREAPLRAFTLASLFVFLLISNAGFPWRMATTGALFALSLSILAASDARLDAGKPILRHVLEWKARYTWWALSVTALCAALALYIAQQAIECESKLVRAIKIALTISQSVKPNDPRWESAKVEMLQLVREGIAINPHYRKLTPMVADAMAGWGDWKNAAWIWESVLESRPHVVVITTSISRAYLQTGNYQKSQDYLDRAAKLQPSAPAVRSQQARLFIQKGKYPEAAQIIREILQTATVDDDLINLAYLIGTRNQGWELVILALELRIKNLPNEASSAWLHLGNIYSRAEVNNEAKALESYRKALKSVPYYIRDGVWANIPPIYQAKLQQTVQQ